ncbi:zinc-ribbon domain-containing protein [Crocinitomicaceae bacterium]|nr:zinc-ribbon domain-containing protein [Crocinitomicaceae bacterium]
MPRKPPPGKSLAEVNPELAKEWHPSKNEELTPFDVTTGSKEKIWWKCDKGVDHQWMASISSRVSGRGCPICSGRMVVKSNCLATTHPEVATQWFQEKNENITPFDVIGNSTKSVWWKCEKGADHIWFNKIRNQTKAKGLYCPFCSGNKVCKSNSLATTHPNLAEEWHPTKNGELTPVDVTSGSGKKVWWKCDKGVDHEWVTEVYNRSNGKGCPFCSGNKVCKSNSLATTHPNLAEEWHPTKNGKLSPQKFTFGSHKKIWWKCQKISEHIYLAEISARVRGRGCTICRGYVVDDSNCIATTHPHLAEEWHPTKNGKLTSNDITIGSTKRIHWKCSKGPDHEWVQSPNNRRITNCPVCSGKKIVASNSLENTNPDLAKQWNPTKNINLLPKDVSQFSNKKVWWQCEKGPDHFWPAVIASRAMGLGCPFCSLTPQSRQELIITFELLTIFKGINPKGFKTRVNGKLWSIDTFIPSLNVGIEFDGAYWHKDKSQLDKVKTEQIEETGLNLIRVRQKPLERLFEDDVMAEKKFDGKQITNDILKQIVKDDGKYAYKLNKRTLDKIDKYLKLEGLQNEKGLDKYIDQILTEKAERKK